MYERTYECKCKHVGMFTRRSRTTWCLDSTFSLNLGLQVLYLSQVDLDSEPTWINVSHDSSTHRGEQLCRNILKLRRIGSDKLYILHFYNWTSSLALTFNLSEQIVHMTPPLIKEKNWAKLFWIICITAEVMAWKNSIYNHFII